LPSFLAKNLRKAEVMQGKGVVRFFLVLMTIVTLFQFLFVIPTGKVERDADAFAQKASAKVKGSDKEGVFKQKRAQYLDSMSSVEVFTLPLLKSYTYQELKAQQLALGLDLKGGMSVVLQVDLKDFIKTLADNSQDKTFLKALDQASEAQKSAQGSYVDLFAQEYSKLTNNRALAPLFARNGALREQIKFDSPNELVISVLREKANSTAELTFQMLRERIDKLGVTGPNISLDKARQLILVELPGIDNPERARGFLQSAAKLEFWNIFRISDPVNPNAATPVNIQKAVIDANALLAKVLGKGDLKKEILRIDTTFASDANGNKIKGKIAKLDTVYSDVNVNQGPLFESFTINDGRTFSPAVVGVAEKNKRAHVDSLLKREEVAAMFPRNLSFVWSKDPITNPETKKSTNLYELYAIKKEGSRNESPLTGEHIVKAYEDTNPITKDVVVSLSMDGEGAKVWANMTTKAAQDNNREVAITLDNEVVSCPRVNEPITGGNTQISGNYTIQDAKDFANILEVGKLPAQTKIIQESLIGPSLGEENIYKGMLSLVFAFLVILAFMILYYAGGGVVAILALVINLFFLIGAMASLGTVLTLPGIAGIVLTIGMAVDANVIIYERIREELREGKSMAISIQEGFKHATAAIMDGNLTTLFVGVALAVFGLGPIKGFAIVLMLGIAATLFTGILVTRLMIEWWTSKGRTINFSYPWSANVLLHQNIDWMGLRKYSYTFSGAVTIICLISMAVRGFDLGVDFKGGYSYTIQFTKPVAAENLRTALGTAFKGSSTVVKAVDTRNTFNVVTSYLVDDTREDASERVMEQLFEGVNKVAGGNLVYENFKSQKGTGTYVTSFSKVGPTIADDIQRSSLLAAFFGLLSIFLYLLLRFNKVKYGIGAIIATVHDALFALGFFSLFHGFLPFNMEIDQAFVAAILTLIGYSINDTVIVFDRIREYSHKNPAIEKKELINSAINSTLSRTIVTSLTVVFTLVVLFLFGGSSIKGFAFCMLVGVMFGTYSSIFIASPIVADLTKGDILDTNLVKRSGSSNPGQGASKSVQKV
jgi:SecD/SecF fusion protein